MDRLEVSWEGIQGTGWKNQGVKGQAYLFLNHTEGDSDGSFIGIDSFVGQGSTYHQRENAIIRIKHNGELIEFKSMDEFFKSIDKSKRI